MPLCGIISSESLGMLPAVWAKECENLLEVTVVTGCDTQLEQQATRGHKAWLKSGEAPRWIGAGRAGQRSPGRAGVHASASPPPAPRLPPQNARRRCSATSWLILVITEGYFKWCILGKKKAVEMEHNFITDKCQNSALTSPKQKRSHLEYWHNLKKIRHGYS